MGARNGGGRRLRFAESTLAIVTVIAATAAQGSDLTVSNGVSTPVNTSNASSGPGNVTVQSGGSISVSTPTAVTIDSSNTVSNAGTISTSTESNATGILGQLTAPGGGALNLTSGITNTGTISVPGPASTSTLYNSNVFNAGIRLNGPGTFTGNILNDTGGTISVGGNSSYGMLIGSHLAGNLTNNATITPVGLNSYGIATTAPVDGSISHVGTINALAQGGVGVYIGAPVGGSVRIGGFTGSPAAAASGNISVGTGPTTDTSGNPVYQVPGTAAVWVAGNVNQGMVITGNGYTKNQENPPTPVGQKPVATNISTTGESTISSTAGGPALLIMPGGPGGPQNIVMGGGQSFTLNGPVGVTGASGSYSVVNQGNILASSTLPRNSNPKAVNPYINPLGIVTTSPGTTYVNVPGLASTGVDIEGLVSNGVTYTTRLNNGFFNAGGDIDVNAANGTATGFKIANNGFVSVIRNTGDILVTATDTTFDSTLPSAGNLGGNAYGILVDPTSGLNSFINETNLNVVSQGLGNSAYAVWDQSGTLTNFYNSGSIFSSVSIYNTTGKAVAVDLSANTTGVTFTNVGRIIGPVHLGSGTNNVTYSGGTQFGDLSFTGGTNTLAINNSKLTGNITLGGGASNVSITNGSVVTGGVVSTGTANLTVSNAQLAIADTQAVRVTNASIDSGSKVTFNLNGTGAATGTIQATGAVSVQNGATLTPVFTGIIQNPQTINLISSNGLTLGAAPTALVAQNTSYMNAYTVQLDPTGNNLQIAARRRSAAEMGLGTNMSVAYEASIPALTLDQATAAAISTQTTKAQFVSAFRQLMPDTSDAWRQAALTNQNLALGAIRRRFQGIPKDPGDEDSSDLSSMWMQALGTAGSASASASDTQPGYSYWGVGAAIGIDTPIGKHTKIGANITEMYTSVDLGASPNSFLLIYSSQLNFYARQDIGRFYIQGIGGGGINNYSQRREITIGSYKRIATGKPNGYQAGGTVEGGVRLEGGNIAIVPYVRAGYMKLHEDGYTEKAGGPVDLVESAKDTTSFRSTVGFDMSKNWALYYDSNLETDLRASYTHDFKDNPILMTSRFASAGLPFNTISMPHGPNIYSFGFGVGHKDSFSSITIDYDAEMAGHFLGHTAAVTLRFRL